MRPALLASALPVRGGLFTVLLGLFLLRWQRWQRWCLVPGKERQAGHGSAELWAGADRAGEKSLGHGGSDGQKVKVWGSWLVAWPRGWVLGAVTPFWL